MFLNNRHYDPTTGVFISVDPLVAKTMQPYIYGAANPVTYSDPTGLDPDTRADVRARVEGNGGCIYSSGLSCFENLPRPDGRTDRNPNNARRRGAAQYAQASLGYGANVALPTVPSFDPMSGGFWHRIGISYSGCVVFCADVTLNADGLSANLGGGMGIMVGGPTLTYSEQRTDTPWGDDGWPARWTDVSADGRGVMICGAVGVGGCYTHTDESGGTWSFGGGAGSAFGMGQPKANVDLPWFWGD